MDSKGRAVGLTLLSSFFWGSSFVVAGYGVDLADPMLFLMMRFLIAAPLVLLVFPLLRIPLGAVMRNRTIWLLGLLNAAAFVMQYVALVWTTATNVALLISTDLILVGIASVAFLGERPTWLLGAAVLMGFTGVAIVEWESGGMDLSATSLRGDLLALGAAFCWTVYIVISKKVLSGKGAMSAEQLTGGVCASTTVVLLATLPFMKFTGSRDLPIVLGLAVYLALFATILAYLLWYKGLAVLSATTTSVILLLEIAFAAILAYAFLGERVGLATVLGGAMICAAAFLAAFAPQK
jgi:drug/metabolite transporter (DMT)-like permease